jgi:hypothetical protein
MPAPEQQYWIIEPLLAAGLDLEQIRALVVRLGFEAALCGGGLDSLSRIVVDRSPEVQAAWHRTIERLLTAPAPTRSRWPGPSPRSPRRAVP